MESHPGYAFLDILLVTTPMVSFEFEAAAFSNRILLEAIAILQTFGEEMRGTDDPTRRARNL
ncbi:UNVERIFIED_CONTAM: hypothetical protein Sradi_0674600 [Sesamum radiatum]|uniref:Uncharacterized protein n=1 Tax=Sesamum radiatum TaxID=300843 RepID=A0AAW2VPY3_SESRA